MATIACDVSEFQPPLDDTYPRAWVILRVCDGDYIDKNAAHNLAWAIRARDTGRLHNFTVYVVYRPFKNATILAYLDHLKVPTDCVVMIDAEAWGGQIGGDHSDEINSLAVKLRARQGGRDALVWAYGNRGPDLGVWPRKPGWLGWVVASYGGTRPDEPNMAGWQYTNGQYSVAGLPNSTQPFGHCDHNVLLSTPGRFQPRPPGTHPTITTDGKELTMTPAEADSIRMIVRQETSDQIRAVLHEFGEKDPTSVAQIVADAITAAIPRIVAAVKGA